MASKPIIAVFLILVLAGCSSLRLAYFGLDVAARNQVAFYLDLEDEDERLFADAAMDRVLDWHQLEMLPRYAAFLREQAGVLEAGDVSREQVMAAMRQIRALYEETVRGATAEGALVLKRHASEPRRGYLKARFDEKNTEREERLAEPMAERIERRADRQIRNIERFLGELSGGQRDHVRAYASATASGSSVWLSARKSRQKAFLAYLATDPEIDGLKRYLDKILLAPDENMAPGYRQFIAGRTERFGRLMFDIISSLTEDQRETAVNRLRGYADELLAISS